MSRDFNKGNFQKGEVEKKCHHCNSDDTGFTLFRKKLNEVGGDIDGYNRVRVQNHAIPYQIIPGLSVLHEKLQKNIFTTFDTNEYGTETEKMIQVWRIRMQKGIKLNPNEGLLEVLHFLGNKEGYNKLLLSLPLVLDELLIEFHLKIRDQRAPNNDTDIFLKRVKDNLLNGMNNRNGQRNLTWFTDESQEEAIDRIRHCIRPHINSRKNTIRSSEINELANSIYETLSNLGVKKFGDWEENYSNNSPLAISIPKHLAQQFDIKGIFEGIEYCNYCGAEHSRSLMYSGKFYPFTEVTAENSPETQDYLGRIQDFESELLPQIQELWREQIKELKRRDKKASKMWDGAEDRLQKKKDAEEEAKRQAEIAQLEKKLNALKKNGK